MIPFFSYIKNPISPEGFQRIGWKHFFLMILIYLALALPLGLIGYITLKLTGVTRIPLEFSLYQKLFFVILLGPLSEELQLRLLLVFNRRNVVVFVSTCAALAIIFFFKHKSKYLIYAILVAISSIVYLYHHQFNGYVSKHYKLFFFFFAVLFGLLHIMNFTGITVHNFIFMPLLVLPQILLGLILGYIRVIYGFGYGLLFHSMVNTSIFL